MAGIIDTIKNIAKKKDPDNKVLKLEKWKTRLDLALINHDGFRNDAALWDAQYNGTKEIQPLGGNNYMSDKSPTATQDARQVVNLTFQLIESAIMIDVPKPTVQNIEDAEDLDRQKMVEGSIEYIARSSEMERLVSENERIDKKNGLAIFKVIYDPDYDGHTYRGRIKTVNPHPCNVIPQPGVYRIEDMDYIFHIETRTLDQACRKYGEEFRELLSDEGAQYCYLENFNSYDNKSYQQGKVSVVEGYFKDKDNDVCLIVWVNNVILKEVDKFYYKRNEDGSIKTVETVDITNMNPDGSSSMETVNVKCKVPHDFPFIIQYNVLKEKSYYGKSDPEIIRDQQEGIKKLLSIEEEKHIKGTTKIFVRRGTGLERKITNASSQIIETDDPNTDIKVVDLKTNDQTLLNLYQIYTQAAKDSLGITEASQGRSEGSTLSGKALELLSQNTRSRMDTKQFEKNIAFTKLYQLYFDFMLAYYDDPVPYRVEGTEKPEFGYFDKSKLIKQDDAGEWYFPAFDIYISADSGLPKDKNFVVQTITNALQTGAIDPVDYWYVLDSIGFPNAAFILERAKEKEQLQKDQQQQQMDMQNQQLAMQNQQMGINQQQQQADMQGNDNQAEQNQLAMDTEKHQQEMQMNAEKHQQEMQIAQAKLQMEAQSKSNNQPQLDEQELRHNEDIHKQKMTQQEQKHKAQLEASKKKQAQTQPKKK